MPVSEQERRRAMKRRFILGGVAAGVLLSSGYVGLNLAGMSLTGAPAQPDPVVIRFVNIFLIMAACVLQASILGRVAGFLTKKRGGTQ